MTNTNPFRGGAHISRRAFAERLALAAAAPFVLADLSPEVQSVAEKANGGEAQAEPSALAKALAEGIRLRWPDRFTPEDLAAITRSIDGRLRGLEQLYRVPLTNGDEPDFVYAVHRGTE